MQTQGRRERGADIGEEREGCRHRRGERGLQTCEEGEGGLTPRQERGSDVQGGRVVQTYGRRQRGAADVG